MSMTLPQFPQVSVRNAINAVGALLVAAVTFFVLARLGVVNLELVKNAACDGPNAATCSGNATGLGGFTKAADALVSPAVIAMIAIAPLGCLVGAAALMWGNRKGLVIIGSSLGTLVFIASLKGIVA